MGGALRYKQEEHCGANSRCIAAFPFLEGSQASLQTGGVLRYKLEVYCSTFKASCTGWGF